MADQVWSEQEGKMITRFDIVPQHRDVLVAVGARVLVGEAQHVHQLVRDVAVTHAVVAEHHHLMGREGCY